MTKTELKKELIKYANWWKKQEKYDVYFVDNKFIYQVEDNGLHNVTSKEVVEDYLSNPLSCIGCKYNNTTNDELCGTCGDTYKNKAT